MYFKAYAGVSRTEKQKQSPGDVRLKRFRKNFAKLKKKQLSWGLFLTRRLAKLLRMTPA